MLLYPVNLQVAGKSCLVVGGGQVGLRKVTVLIECDARVTVISPEVVPELGELSGAGRIKLHRRDYRSGDLDGAFLVFATTDNNVVQEQVAAEAAERRVLLNIADRPDRCDFQVPSRIRRGKLLLTVSTGGASPALAKLIRGKLEEQFDDVYGTIISLFGRLRHEVVERCADSAANRDLFGRLLAADLVGLVRAERWPEVTELLTAELPPDIGVEELLAGLGTDTDRSA